MASKNTNSIKTGRKKVLITDMQGKTGTNKHDRQGIADVLTEFYEELYTSTSKTQEHEHEDNDQLHHSMTPFTMQELNSAINQLKRAKLQTQEGSTQK